MFLAPLARVILQSWGKSCRDSAVLHNSCSGSSVVGSPLQALVVTSLLLGSIYG
jgi:hypothetical protein